LAREFLSHELFTGELLPDELLTGGLLPGKLLTGGLLLDEMLPNKPWANVKSRRKSAHLHHSGT
jgi:hypothetical protein